MTNSKPIFVEQSFPVRPDVVWQAVTRPKLMRQRCFDSIVDFRPEVGFETQFDVESGGRTFRHRWKVIGVLPGQSITYSWRYEGYAGLGTTEWSLSETEGGSNLVHTWTGIESFPQDISEFTRESGLAGWHYFIKQSLPSFLGRA